MPSTRPASERTLFVGDVHGCPDELDRLLRQAQADRVVLVGDLFTKGPDPAGVWSLIQEHGCEAVLGNHDDYNLRHPQKSGLPDEALRWLAQRPLFLLEPGLTVVHGGVHPKLGVSGTSRQRALTSRGWMDAYDRGNFVVYGHDAARGLTRTDKTLGLDSGCVYGGQLSGWLREEDRLLQVPAARVYRAIKAKAAIS